MAYKDPNDPRNALRKHEHYLRNKEQWIKKRKEKKAELLSLVNSFKDGPCMDCGVRYPPYVMDFDHRNPTEKYKAVSRLINDGNANRILEEIKKCDLVCSNCHRERTYKAQQAVLV